MSTSRLSPRRRDAKAVFCTASVSTRPPARHRWLAILLILSLLLSACDSLAPLYPTPSYPAAAPQSDDPLPTPFPAAVQAMVTFRLTLPATLSPGEIIHLTILDEITGLAFNQQQYRMEAEDAQHFIAIIPLALNTIVKYRYERSGAYHVLEHTADGRAVRYRLFQVNGPALVQDTLSRWTDTTFNGSSGRIYGEVLDAQTGEPLPSILVAAGGAQTLTRADGSYLLEGLPPGSHNLAAYSLDGSYQTYQQNAQVEAGSATPAPIRLSVAPLVNLVFAVSAPADTPPDAVLRLAGNFSQLGNTFADLGAGLSAIAARMPELARLPDGRFSLTLTLPAGADLRYRYTLGDGLWNSERSTTGSPGQGQFFTRQLIVPAENRLIEDTISTWKEAPETQDSLSTLRFEVAVAPHPQGETIAIQFNPGFGWAEPIPMWPAANNRWSYTLFSPLAGLSTLKYRYCRGGLCGSADESGQEGLLAAGRSVSLAPLYPAADSQAVNGVLTIQDTVASWAWIAPANPVTVPNISPAPRGESFFAGIEYLAAYHPAWGPLLTNAVQESASLNGNWLVLSPTWSYTHSSPPVLEPVAGYDMPYPELVSTLLQARNLGMSVALFPQPRFSGAAQDWWISTPHDFPFWVSWFNNYREFILHHADLASQYGAGALVMGGEWLGPALPGGLLADGSSTGLPEDAAERWHALIAEVRTRFSGSLLWAIPSTSLPASPAGAGTLAPAFLSDFDMVYILWSAPLAETPGADAAALAAGAGRSLDQIALPFQQQIEKPVIIAAAYPSAQGGSTGCLPASEGACLAVEMLDRPRPDVPNLAIDLPGQAEVYKALLQAVSDRPWISGFVSRGYYPPIALQDKSASIHGKPAAGVLWFWFGKLLGK